MNIYTIKSQYGKIIGEAECLEDAIAAWCDYCSGDASGAKKVDTGGGQTHVVVQDAFSTYNLYISETKPMFVGAKYRGKP